MRLVVVLFCLLSQLLISQNLVLNSSFENYKGNLIYKGDIHKAYNWSSPNLSTPDLFLFDNNNLGEKLFDTIESEPENGYCYAGIIMYIKNYIQDYREYLQGELKQSLIKGLTYKVSFYVRSSVQSNFSVNEIGIVFTDLQVGLMKKATNIFSKKANHITIRDLSMGETCLNLSKTERFKIERIDLSNVIIPFDNWLKIEFEYIASGFENYLILGNLNNDKKTILSPLKKTEKRDLAYYYIDDISVVKKTKPITFQPEKTYTFKNVLFDFDKAILLEVSIEELDKLSLHLKENPNLNIEIYGHTDNVGLETRNKELSLQRAKAVSGYLIYKGLDTSKIKWFGFGAEQPVVENSSEENRATNRRVDFKLIKN